MANLGTLVMFGMIGGLIVNGSVSWTSVVGLGCFLFIAFLVFLYRCQDQMLYQPRIYPQWTTPAQNPAGYRHPGERGLPYEEVFITTADNLRLQSWFVRPEGVNDRKSRPTILFFHANAGNMGFRLDNIKMMYDTLGCNVFILSYRGYGASEGTPSEEGLLVDAQAAWEYLHNRTDIDTDNIVVFGRSLGGSVAIALAQKHCSSIRALIIENTFVSVAAMADALFPFLRIPYAKETMLKLKWPAGERIQDITCPILFLSGAQDEVVPPNQMQTLHDLATKCTQKRIEIFSTGQHNNTWTEGGLQYINAFQDYLNRFAMPTSTSTTSNLSISSPSLPDSTPSAVSPKPVEGIDDDDDAQLQQWQHVEAPVESVLTQRKSHDDVD